MSNVPPPIVRSLIPCDEAILDPQWPGRLRITGFIPFLRWTEGENVLRLDRLTALVILVDGRGTGRGRVVCINEETGLLIVRSEERPITSVGRNPSVPTGYTFTLRDCRFPAPGAYLVQFLYDDVVICEQPLTVR